MNMVKSTFVMLLAVLYMSPVSCVLYFCHFILFVVCRTVIPTLFYGKISFIMIVNKITPGFVQVEQCVADSSETVCHLPLFAFFLTPLLEEVDE